jgi:hypothetical protein
MLAGQSGEAPWAGLPGLNWHATKNYIKGVGETGIILTATAIANAVEDTLARGASRLTRCAADGCARLSTAPGDGEAQEGTLMERSRLIWIGVFVGSAVGGYVPALWGAGMLSFSSVIGSAIGGVAGIWLGYRLGE